MSLTGWLRRVFDDGTDPAWKPTGIKPAERTWSIDRDHNDPRARRQLMAEVKARRVQAERRGEDTNVREFPQRRA